MILGILVTSYEIRITSLINIHKQHIKQRTNIPIAAFRYFNPVRTDSLGRVAILIHSSPLKAQKTARQHDADLSGFQKPRLFTLPMKPSVPSGTTKKQCYESILYSRNRKLVNRRSTLRTCLAQRRKGRKGNLHQRRSLGIRPGFRAFLCELCVLGAKPAFNPADRSQSW